MNTAIRRLRKKAGLTQAELAKAMGYNSPTIVTMWESGDRKPPSDKLPQLAKTLECSIDELFGEYQETKL